MKLCATSRKILYRIRYKIFPNDIMRTRSGDGGRRRQRLGQEAQGLVANFSGHVSKKVSHLTGQDHRLRISWLITPRAASTLASGKAFLREPVQHRHDGGVGQVPVTRQELLNLGNGQRLTGPPQQHHHLLLQLTPGYHDGILRATGSPLPQRRPEVPWPKVHNKATEAFCRVLET